jgi:hypothetical protein
VIALRKSAVLVGLLGLTLLGTSCGERTVEYQADWPTYENVDALYDRADLVVQGALAGPGKVQELNIGGDSSETTVYPVVELTAARVFKGSATSGQKIQLKQLGGRLKGVDHRAGDMVYLAQGKTYLLFLQTYPDSPASLLNPQQGQYVLDASGAATPLPGNNIKVSSSNLARLTGNR